MVNLWQEKDLNVWDRTHEMVPILLFLDVLFFPSHKRKLILNAKHVNFTRIYFSQIKQKKNMCLPSLFFLFAAVMKLDWIDTQIDRTSLIGTLLLLGFGMSEIFSFHFAQIDRCFFAIFISTLYGKTNKNQPISAKQQNEKLPYLRFVTIIGKSFVSENDSIFFDSLERYYFILFFFLRMCVRVLKGKANE